MSIRNFLGVAVIASIFACPVSPIVQAADEHSESAQAEEGADAHGEGEGLNPVAPPETPDLAVWTAVVFLILCAVLYKFAWGPISAGLDKREQGIANDIAEAEKANADAKQLLAEYEQKLADSREEVRQILAQAKVDAEKAGQEIVENARAAAEAEKQRALGEIDLATTGALKELAERSATLAVDLAGKIVKANLDEKAHQALIAGAISDFVEAGPSHN